VPGEHDFEQVLRTYQDKVYRLCWAMLGDRALAEDTAQEVFVRVWKSLASYRGESSLSTWIYSITRNTCLTARKKKAADRGISMEETGVRIAAERAGSGAQSPDRTPDILRLVDQLPDQYRQVIRLYHMEEKSYEEVALMLDLPLGTVKTYLHRARKQLAEALAVSSTMTGRERS
jgi:RNA polymerase sigma-70 factor (ECF subfamily)